jgi:DNA-binding transcriptional LysR family regulator
MIDPDQLRLLQVVARTGSYSAASRELGYTQPAITYQMHCLERSVGSALAVRNGRSMQLTAAGRVLLEHAGRILAEIRGAENDLAALAGEPAGTIRLGAFPSSCAALVPRAMVAMKHTHPRVEVDLVQSDLDQAHEAVRRGDVDVALTYHSGPCEHDIAPAGKAGLIRLPVTVDEIHIVVPAGHRTAGRHIIGIEQLADETWIIAGHRYQQMLESSAAAVGFTPRVMQVADDFVTMQSLVAHGLGVALVPGLALAAHRDPRIVPRTLRDWPDRHIEVEMWPDVLRVETIRAFVEHLRRP